MDSNSILRKLPKMDQLIDLASKAKRAEGVSVFAITENCKCVLGELRKAILSGETDVILSPSEIVSRAHELAMLERQCSLRPVINATGVVIHTNLGRAVMSQAVAEHVKQIASSYSTLEYDLNSGERGSRHSHIDSLITKITGAEAAMVVNNNAAAIMLALQALCCKREVIVSRGELVEIGGSFRVPDIMKLSGTTLVEVGTTNKTRLSDYQNAINVDTAALLKVHTSNFKIVGFSESVQALELATLAHEQEIPLIYDLGSGMVTANDQLLSTGETTVQRALNDGADVVCFSGDKLFGGAQAGIIVGKKEYIDQMKSHQLARALRIDKLSLAALEATLRIYLDPTQALTQIPVLSAITTPLEELKKRAQALKDQILTATNDNSSSTASDITATVKKSEGQIGGGSAPGEELPSFVVEITSKSYTATQIEQHLRFFATPIIARINKGSVLLDVRTIKDSELSVISEALASLKAGCGHE